MQFPAIAHIVLEVPINTRAYSLRVRVCWGALLFLILEYCTAALQACFIAHSLARPRAWRLAALHFRMGLELAREVRRCDSFWTRFLFVSAVHALSRYNVSVHQRLHGITTASAIASHLVVMSPN